MLQQEKIGQALVGSIVIHLWKGIQAPLFVITRAKEHLVGKSDNVASCKKTPPDVVKELKGYMANKKSGTTYSSTGSGNVPNIRF